VRLLVTLGLALAAAGPAHATALSVFRVGDAGAIYISADSRSIDLETGRVTEVCKINQASRCVFAVAGVATWSTGFNAKRFARDACGEPGDVDAQMQSFLRTVKASVEAAYRHAVEDGRRPDIIRDFNTQLTLVGRRGGDVVALGSGYRLKSPPDAADPLEATPVVEYRGRTWRAHREHLQHIMREAPNRYWRDPDFVARRLVELDTRPEVGGPTSVLRIEGRGRATWVDPGLCPALDPKLLP